MILKKLENLILCSFFLLITRVVYAQQPIMHTVYFTINSPILSASESNSLKRILDSVTRLFEIDRISVSGNTDNIGGTAYNSELSEQRAGSVRNFFISAGIESGQILFEFQGENVPVASNKTAHGRQLNRRVDITFFLKNSPEISEAPVIAEPEGDIGRLYGMLKTNPQEYCIDVTRDTFLIGNRGTIIHYKANTIKRENLSCRCFTLKLNEYFDNGDLILNNLTTTSNRRLLESGGMIKLDGYCDGQQYELKSGEFFTVMVPTDTVLPDMKLLSANRANDMDYLNWQLDPVNPDLDNFDFNLMMWACRVVQNDISSAKCHLFFCKFGRFFKRLFTSERYYSKKDEQNNKLIEKEQALLKKYELKGEDLAIALQKSKDNAGLDALKYYVYKNSNWDYRNIDRLVRVTKFTNFIVDVKPSAGTDVKLIFRGSRTVVPSFEKSSSYLFREVSDGVDVWVLGLRYTTSGEIYLGLRESNTSEKKTSLEFKQVSVEELKLILQKLIK